MRDITFSLLLVSMLVTRPAPRPASAEDLATYEDWSTAATIRADRWAASSDLGHERRRELHGSTLAMRYRREGLTFSDTGSTGFFSNRLGLRNPVSVTQLEADLEVRDLIVTGCMANPTASIARAAAIDLNRMSDLPPGTPSAPGDLTGDHIARIEVRRLSDSMDPDGVMEVRALLFRSDNPGGTLTTLVAGPIILGQVATRQVFQLRLSWNPESNEFRAALNDGPNASLAYTPASNARPANSPFATIRIQHLPANCTAGPTVGDAEIAVHAVRTNASAVIP